jgi:nitric oxide dioxygenase
MANALINQERGLYSARGVRPETVWRQWQVDKKIPETDDVVTFVVKIDDRRVKTSLPGQYVTVLMPMPDGVRQPRQYRLSVKRVHGDGKPPVRCPRCCTTRSSWATCSPCRCPSVTSCSTMPGVRWCSSAPGSASPRMAGMLSHLVAAGSGPQIMLLHADVHEGSFALRRQVVSDVLALKRLDPPLV